MPSRRPDPRFRPPSRVAPPESHWTRRQFLAAAVAGGGAAALTGLLPWRAEAATTFRWTPFSRRLALPPDAQESAPFDLDEGKGPDGKPRLEYLEEWRDDDVGFRARYFQLHMKPGVAEIIPGVTTPIWGYDGIYPGPTIRARAPARPSAREVIFVRFHNELPTECVIHLHGGHMPAESDGFTNDFIHEGGFRDHAYPMIPAGDDPTDMQSYLWYHDHAMDETGINVYRGLEGLFLIVDDAEAQLIADRVIPPLERQYPLVLQDRSFNRDGTLFYNFFEHDGFLGDVQIVNGAVQPFLEVERRKYRFRLLNGANARMFNLRLTSGEFVQIGADGWFLPRAVARREMLLAMAERADVIIDFRNAPNEVYLLNTIDQDDGRGPDGTRDDLDRADRPFPLVKFVVKGAPIANDVTIQAGRALNALAPIDPREARVTRRFEFERSGGAWVINGRIFDPERSDATPKLGSTERWILENKGGGWWHPVHVHDEGFRIQRIGGRAPPPWEAGLKDTVNLGPNDVAEVLLRFRDWPGRWVFHCHNIEHEDVRMMSRFDVVR
jgi:FtsP/CotA-like multicopper oxidase with cupredoxin domain